MKAIHWRIIIVLLLLLQVAWFLQPGDRLADPYRYKERQKAYLDWMRDKTPESHAIFQKERGRLYDHQGLVAIVTVLSFLVLDGVGIYYFWNYGIRKTMAQQVDDPNRLGEERQG